MAKRLTLVLTLGFLLNFTKFYRSKIASASGSGKAVDFILNCP